MKSHLVLAASAAVIGMAATAHAAVDYTVTDLGILSSPNIENPGSYGIAVNDSGQTVGRSYVGDGDMLHAFRRSAVGVMSDLGTLGGRSSQAEGINLAGQVVGTATTVGDGATHAFRTNPAGVMTDLGTLGGASSGAHGINSSGEVIGWATTGTEGVQHAFRTDAAGVMSDMGTLGGPTSIAHAINDSGQVAGWSDVTAADSPHAFRTDASGNMVDLGTLGGRLSGALAINASGQVAGYSTLGEEGPSHAFRTDAAGVMMDLGTMTGVGYSYAFGINDAGDVVGVGNGSLGVLTAFLFTDGRGMVDLNTLIAPGSGWTLEQAQDINNVGQIIGWGSHDGRLAAFLPTPVPEPSSALSLLGLGGLALLRRQRLIFK